MFITQQLSLHGEGFSLQLFRLFQFACETQSISNVEKCRRNQRVFIAEQPPSHRQNLSRSRFRFSSLALVAENQTQVVQ